MKDKYNQISSILNNTLSFISNDENMMYNKVQATKDSLKLIMNILTDLNETDNILFDTCKETLEYLDNLIELSDDVMYNIQESIIELMNNLDLMNTSYKNYELSDDDIEDILKSIDESSEDLADLNDYDPYEEFKKQVEYTEECGEKYAKEESLDTCKEESEQEWEDRKNKELDDIFKDF